MAEGEGDRSKPDWAAAYEQGLELYHADQWLMARERFHQAIQLRGEDPPSARFLKLCEERLAAPRRRKSDEIKPAAAA